MCHRVGSEGAGKLDGVWLLDRRQDILWMSTCLRADGALGRIVKVLSAFLRFVPMSTGRPAGRDRALHMEESVLAVPGRGFFVGVET